MQSSGMRQVVLAAFSHCSSITFRMCINAYIKEGTSTHTTQSAMAKCEYKIKVQKTPPCERMEGEGYRLKRVG